MSSGIITIITSLITAGIPACVTLWTSRKTKVDAEKQSKRASILALITMDKVNWQEGKPPVNQVSIHRLFDEYIALGGNSFIVDVMDDYDGWIKSVEKTTKKRKNRTKTEQK